MNIADSIKSELQMGLRLLAFKSLTLELAPMSYVDAALRGEGWEAITGISHSGPDGTELNRYYYSSMQKAYAHVCCNGYTGACEVKNADETEMLEGMTFEEIKHLGNLIDKKSVAFIRIYSEKELANAKTDEELQKLNARKEKMVAEAEVALRKR